MTLAELEYQLPNGFHDCEVLGLDLDEQKKSATLRFNLLVSLPSDGSPEVVRYKIALVRLIGVSIVDTPTAFDSHYTYQAQGFIPDVSRWDRLAGLSEEHKPLAYGFYLDELNDDLYLVAEKSELLWLDQ